MIRTNHDTLRFGLAEKIMGLLIMFGPVTPVVLYLWNQSDQLLLLRQSDANQTKILEKLVEQAGRIPISENNISHMKDRLDKIESNSEKSVRYWETWLQERKQ